MKSSPVIATLVIINLAVITFLLIEKSKSTLSINTTSSSQEEGEKYVIEANPEFRFTSMPKRITFKNNKGEILYDKTEFDSEYELEELETILLPIDSERKSELQLIVEWKTQPKPYHFLMLEFYGTKSGNFATATSSDIYENIVLEW